MEQAVNQRNIKVIKSVQMPDSLIAKEVQYGEYADNAQVLDILRLLELQYAHNPLYEKLHGLKERLSISFRNKDTQETISFTAQG